MDARLRNWAATGRYTEEDAPSLDTPRTLGRRPAAWGTTPMIALLVPVGIVCGALLAVAYTVRLIVLPFTGRRGSP